MQMYIFYKISTDNRKSVFSFSWIVKLSPIVDLRVNFAYDNINFLALEKRNLFFCDQILIK